MAEENKPEKSASQSLTETFMRSLREAEASHDPKNLVRLFTEQAQLENLTSPASHKSHHTGATAFWSQYLGAFERIESHFTHVFDDGKNAVLEWHSTGCLATGTPVDYSGVSILEYEGQSIKKFRTYYDSAALLPHAVKTERRFSESVGLPELTNEAGS